MTDLSAVEERYGGLHSEFTFKLGPQARVIRAL